MELLGRVWNKLDEDDRMALLKHCRTITSDGIKQHEATLSWRELMPVTQRDLLNIEVESILGRDVCP